MSELEDGISRILNDPAQMEQIASLAKSLMGGEPAPGPQENGLGTNGPGGLGELAKGLLGGEDLGLDPKLLTRIGRLMSAGNSQSSESRALLEAMKPYLSEKRRAKMDRAMHMARMAKMAQLAMGDLREDGDV